MPGFNKKGPTGEGPMTGRRMGRCTDFGARELENSDNLSNNETDFTPFRGAGRGRADNIGMGRGRGFRIGRGLDRGNRCRGRFIGGR